MWRSRPAGSARRSRWGARLFRAAADAYAAEGERRLLWLPVFFGAGIGVYFSLTFEPPLWLGFGAAILAAGTAPSRCTGARWRARRRWR